MKWMIKHYESFVISVARMTKGFSPFSFVAVFCDVSVYEGGWNTVLSHPITTRPPSHDGFSLFARTNNELYIRLPRHQNVM